MDITEAFGLEFLDLSGVDEYEKSKVLSSLQPSSRTPKFPWFIGDEETPAAGLKPARQNSLNTVSQPPTNDHGYIPLATTSRRAPIPIINPITGVAIPISTNLESNSIPEPLPTNPGDNQLLNNQYFSPVPQYFPPPVVTTIPSVPVRIQPTTYGSFTVPSTNQHEIPVNTTIFPTYLPPSYPVKPPVFYGVPPAQPIFVSHQTSSAVSESYYQNNTTQYVENISTNLAPLVENNANITTVPHTTTPCHETRWVTNDTQQSPTVLSSTSLVQTQNALAKKPASPLSADSPAFTPKNLQNISLVPQNLPVTPELPPQIIQTSSTSNSTIVSHVSPIEKSPEVVSRPQEAKTDTTTGKPAGIWGSGKSWASLFTPKDGAVGGPQINGVTKTSFEAANKESNNNVACPIKNPKRSPFIDPDCYRMGEFLTNYEVDGRAVSLQPRGLINQSNYCYINSILQALIACPPMYNLLSGLSENISSNAKRKPTPVIDGICKFVKDFKHLPANMRVSNRRSDGGAGGKKQDPKKDQGVIINTDIPFEPSWIYKMLNGIHSDLIEGRQEDAEEFLGCLLNSLNDEMLELIKLIRDDESEEQPSQIHKFSADDEENWQVMGSKNKGSILRKTTFERTPITDIFGGSLKSRIHKTGDLITENTQPFLTLQLNIEKVKTVREALEALTTKNQLEGVTSSKTNEEVEAWQQVMLDELPVVLVLHLKCFDFQLDGCTKIVKALEFPIDLKIDGKLISSKTTNAKEKQYKLFAVVYHDGKEATKGHYITDAFHVGYSSWLRYDDASVKQVQEEQVLNPQGTRVPYLLFYRRSDTIRSR